MAELNYNHLRYLWAVVREGGVSAASRALNVSQPTVSAQLRKLEAASGDPLFLRSGRALAQRVRWSTTQPSSVCFGSSSAPGSARNRRSRGRRRFGLPR